MRPSSGIPACDSFNQKVVAHFCKAAADGPVLPLSLFLLSLQPGDDLATCDFQSFAGGAAIARMGESGRSGAQESFKLGSWPWALLPREITYGAAKRNRRGDVCPPMSRMAELSRIERSASAIVCFIAAMRCSDSSIGAQKRVAIFIDDGQQLLAEALNAAITRSLDEFTPGALNQIFEGISQRLGQSRSGPRFSSRSVALTSKTNSEERCSRFCSKRCVKAMADALSASVALFALWGAASRDG